MTTDGPDMTPQGIADALDDLVTDLPGQTEKLSGSWQKVLGLQAVGFVLGGNWSDAAAGPDLQQACLEAQHAVVAALKAVLRERPALHQALIAAFGLAEAEAAGAPPPDTTFSKTPFGEIVVTAALMVSEEAEESRLEGHQPSPPPSVEPLPV